MEMDDFYSDDPLSDSGEEVEYIDTDTEDPREDDDDGDDFFCDEPISSSGLSDSGLQARSTSQGGHGGGGGGIKSHETPSTSVTEDELRARQIKEAAHVAGILNVSTEDAATLLRHAHWKKERLVEEFFVDPDRISALAGVTSDDVAAPALRPAPPGFCCDVCCDGEDEEILSLACGHTYCRPCYTRYVEEKVRGGEGQCRKILCLGKGCTLRLGERTIRLLLSKPTPLPPPPQAPQGGGHPHGPRSKNPHQGPPKAEAENPEHQAPSMVERYASILNRSYVDDIDGLRWCPAPGCEYAVECRVLPRDLDTTVPTVACACGHLFCHGCGLDEGHRPCPCHVVRRWLKKCADDSETANWLGANTKECPICQSTTEKNGGCNHMTCKKCGHDYCWVCMGPWTEHGTQYYNCNRFEEDSSKVVRDRQAQSRYALDRYLHYFRRYDNHHQSAKLDESLYRQTERKMEEMQKTSDLTWIECQFLRRACDTLVASRMTLKWTYAFAFYLSRTNQTELFEDNQRDLEMAVEQLSGMLTEEIPDAGSVAKLRASVLDKTVYVAQRRDVMLEDTAKGLAEGRWTFLLGANGEDGTPA